MPNARVDQVIVEITILEQLLCSAQVPDVGGMVGTSAALSTTYNMVKQAYDGNPVSGKAWQLTDFGSVRFGPTVTA